MTVTEEKKKYVTPYAFKVSEDIVGTPLASPSKRLFAILIDMVLVGLLTTVSWLVFTGLVAITAFFGYNNVRQQSNRSGVAQILLGVSLLSTLIVLVGIWNPLNININVGDQAEVVAPANATDTVAATQIEEADSAGIITWVQGTISDLGLSFGWAALYFTVFAAWLNGRTPGKLLFGIRVIKIDGKEISLWEGFERYGGYTAGLATGLLGFLQIYWDVNRQAIHDKISETMVIDVRKPRAELVMSTSPR